MHHPTMTGLTPDASAPASVQPLYVSPILKSLASVHRPSPSPACETCPASIWFSTSDQLRCFCTRMHLMVWDETVPPVMTCDGRELSLLQLQQELQAMEEREGQTAKT
jgi:hypothetical protein